MDIQVATRKRLCLDCDKPVHGRVDKKFCNDQCRVNHNNKINHNTIESVKSINIILKKNRSILSKLSEGNSTKISSIKLLGTGFNRDYHTHTYKNSKGELYIFCYDYGYLTLANEEFLIIKKKI